MYAGYSATKAPQAFHPAGSVKAGTAAGELLRTRKAACYGKAIDRFSTTAVKIFVFLSPKRIEKGDSEGDL